MSLQFDPSLNFGTSGNALPLTNLNHNPNAGSGTSFIADFSQNLLGGFVQLWIIATGINATNGLQISSYSTSDNVWYDTNPYGYSAIIPAVVSGIVRQSFSLDTGKYTISLTNTDPFNGISVMATTGQLN